MVMATWAEPTSSVGLIATASTTYTEPFNLARQFASIDHISNGSAAWNIVTSWLATAAENYGGASQMSHADRSRRGVHGGGEKPCGPAGRPRRGSPPEPAA